MKELSPENIAADQAADDWLKKHPGDSQGADRAADEAYNTTKRQSLKKGDRVKIQNTTAGGKPIIEGIGTLVKFHRRDPDGLEWWDVRFDGDKETYGRWVTESGRVG